MKQTNSIFAIVKTNFSKPRIMCMFLEQNFNNAKLWFQGYLKGEKTTGSEWILYKVGEIDEDLHLKGFKIYICTGLSVIKQNQFENTKYEQYSIFRERQEELKKAESLKKLYEKKASMEEIIKEAFGGNYANGTQN